MEELVKLTKEVALETVYNIKENSGDDEGAHSMEDALHFWFIKCIAAGMYEKEESVEIANIVKSTSEIKFARWFA